MTARERIHDAALVRFRRALDGVYGDRIERVVLFGSRARGDAGPDSDYDVAVFLRDPGELWDELGTLSHITTSILNDTGSVISAKPYAAGAYRERSPLMHEIRAEGLDLWRRRPSGFLRRLGNVLRMQCFTSR